MSVDLNTVVPVNGLDDYNAQSPKDDAAATALPEQPSSLNGVALSSSQSMEVEVSSENDDDVSAAAVDPVDVVPDLNVAGPTSSSDDVPENEINQEVVDLGTDPHFYEDNKKKVGYDRGLEPDHIVGATEKNGKLMFLIEWKNSIDGEADLVEAKEVYKRSPQIAIQFFEKRICFIHSSKKT
ncbi:heterochromatin protein 1-like isoform X1 [Aphis gossypii]|uniref:heterochromatin protein 1-like isoform X1 n=1 Tax=Aphis gossypii TaxID=80765 RepID=UPI0021598D78|nr:heterochromatin protein 1-like isoform X1 [Aphis gossypii]